VTEQHETDGGAAPRGSSRAWLVVSAYVFLITMTGTTLPTPLYAIYQAEWGITPLASTVVFATYAVGVILALVLLGRSSDVAGRRPLLALGLVFSALSAGVFLLADGLGWLLVGRLLSGLSAGVFTGTATTALVELAGRTRGGPSRRTASLIATAVNMLGLGAGPLLAGVLAEWAPAPLRTPYVVHLLLLVPAAVGLWRLPETVRPTGAFRITPLRPTVPAVVRPAFVAASLAGFAGFATLGLFTAVEPRFLAQVLGVESHAAAGVVVCAIFVASTLAQVASARVTSRTALPVGCAALVLGMALVVTSLLTSDLAVLVVGSVVAGAGQGTSFRAGVEAVTSRAPAESGAAVVSTLFVVLYVAISLPVVGVGLLAAAGGIVQAAVVFAVVVAVLALLAVVRLLRTPATA